MIARRFTIAAWIGAAAAAALLVAAPAARAGASPDSLATLARTLEARANVRLVEGALAAADSDARRALDIRTRNLEPTHPDVVVSLVQMAGIAHARGDEPAALDYAVRGEKAAIERLRRTAREIGERPALQYAATRPSGLDLALSVVVNRSFEEAVPKADRSREIARAWQAVMDSRARVLDEMALLHRAREAPERPGLSEALDALPRGCALVAFARYFQAPPQGEDSRWYLRPDAEPERAQYVALVAKDREAALDVVPLGPAAGVDSAIARYVREAGRRPNPLTITADEGRVRTLGLTVRRLVWEPIATAVDSTREVFIVPDGSLLLLNFATLPDAPGKFLVEKAPPIHLLTTERDLLIGPRPRGTARGLLAIGDPDFDGAEAGGAPARGKTPAAPGKTPATSHGPDPPAGSGSGPPRSAADCADFQALRFAPLAESGGEIGAVAALWRAASAESARVLLKSGASEPAFRALAPAARWLHLATYGFFLPNACGGVDEHGAGVADSIAYQNPLLRSGLALSGANQRARAANRADDGIVTADEIAGLDLSGVETAVLSACQAGLGDLRAGEGVLGLRRGFQIAGVRTVVTSLWAVDAAATREWMSAFYVARVQRRLDLAQAVRAADLWVLFARRTRGESDHPFYWGAFMASGGGR